MEKMFKFVVDRKYENFQRRHEAMTLDQHGSAPDIPPNKSVRPLSTKATMPPVSTHFGCTGNRFLRTTS
ncbi:unnamed protein product [Nezara viridula]|uniref:Uncharacterized protein n=1 Tax=Nezara viridula TaxID=85310 RepID=A0A9P0E296_NEZVI|nr:unnamed protein product [Nezara viridula]